MTKQFLSVEEAAEYLCVSRTLVMTRIRAGALPSLKIGGRRLLPVAALDEWVREAVKQHSAKP